MSTIASRNKLIKDEEAFAASILGAKGGAVKSKAKTKAARENGKLGGVEMIPILDEIRYSHNFFYQKTGISPNKLFVNWKTRNQIMQEVYKYKTFGLCDLGVAKFMGCEVISSQEVKSFLWALVVEE